MVNKKLIDDVRNYYSQKIAEHGATPRGVDWNGIESQELRFEQLCKIVNTSSTFSITDLGCGYGALYDHLSAKYNSFSYSGVDVSEKMIQAAEQRCNGNAVFFTASEPPSIADYCVASGIFNVRLDQTDTEWEAYIENTLDILNRSSRFGFAFNCLTSYSDKDKMRDYLYYANPCKLFDFCRRHYSRNVALLHDYNLYEFTILVRKIA